MSLFCNIVNEIVYLAPTLIVIELLLVFLQVHGDHERSRRETTVNTLSNWCNSIKEETIVAKAIVEKLTPEQCRNLYNRTEFRVNRELYSMLREIANIPQIENEGDECRVSGEALNILRWHVISYLNLLETTLLSWKLEISNQEIIENEFRFLHDSAQGKDCIKNFRDATGNCYPVIDEFLTRLVENEKARTNRSKYRPIFKPRHK